MTREPLWRWPALCRALALPPCDGPDVSGVSIDSRTLRRGDLFVALAGDPGPRFHTPNRSNRDGHDFVAAAVAAGAVGVLAHRPLELSVPVLAVADTLDGLWQLGDAARARLDGRVVAITGSSGKTTARTFLTAALDCPGSTGSLNNFWGVPLSLARTPADAHAAVFEIGTNHPGEIEPLARMVAPDVAVVLNVGQAHLENFPDWQALRREKLAITRGLNADGVAVLPDDLDRDGIDSRLGIVTFGTTPTADVQLLDYRAVDRVAQFRTRAGVVDAAVPGGGRHRALTVGAVLATLIALGRPLTPALRLAERLIPAGRGRRERLGALTVIDDSYNANPVSMRAALELLRDEPGQRYAIVGEMLELGADGPRLHRELASACVGLDGVLCVGEGMRPLHEALPAQQRLGYFERANDVDLKALRTRLDAPAIVLVKGSNRVFWACHFVERLRSAWK